MKTIDERELQSYMRQPTTSNLQTERQIISSSDYFLSSLATNICSAPNWF